MKLAIPAPESVAGVIDGLGHVIEASQHANSRLAYFAVLYQAVTKRVEQGIAEGRFDDGPRMERLDVVFARRYLDALQAHTEGRQPSQSWQAAFDAAGAWNLLILQHLLIGMNAHINLDLGVAAAEVAPGAKLNGLQHDFDEITVLLGEMLDEVQARLGRISPWMGILDWLAGRTDEALFGASLSTSRSLAWKTAKRLAVLDEHERKAEVERLDRIVAALAGPIRHPGRQIQLLLLLARVREPNRVANVVSALR